MLIAGIVDAIFNPLPGEYYIFEDIEACESLISAEKTSAAFERYETPKNDKKVKDLHYLEFFGGKYKSDELKYEIFAYEFEDSDSALRYYVNETRNTVYLKKLPLDKEDENYLLSATSGSFRFDMIVVSGSRAYRLSAPSKYIAEIHELLSCVFSEKLP